MKRKIQKMETTCGENRERRGFFRIVDDVILTYRLVERAEYEQLPDKRSNRDTSAFNLKAKFAALDRSLRPILNRLEERSSDLACYLNMLNEKLDLLADILVTQEKDASNLPSQEVDLSAGGMSFQVQKPIEAGSILKLRMLLQPSGIGIETYAKVVYCKPDGKFRPGGFPYRIGVEFRHMRDEDSDLITRHVLCKEANLRRRHSGND